MQICRFSNLKSFTAKLFLTFAALASTQQMFGQLIDDFSDGDFSTNPAWKGIDEKFVVASQELRLQAPPSTGTAYLTTQTGPVAYEKWEFLVRMDFNPSSTNYSRIYLSSDQPNLSDGLNGYFVLIGGAADEVSLWKQTGSAHIKIIEGRAGLLDVNSFSVRVQVILEEPGVWKLFSDIGSSGNFFFEGSAIDSAYIPFPFLGVFCSYTSTRADKFYFDDFSVMSTLMPDSSPPEIKSLDVVSSTQLRITFSETVDQQTASDPAHYVVVNNQETPSRVLFESGKSVLLSYQQAFTNGSTYSLLVSGIKDLAGNVISSSQLNFTFVEPISAAFKDIIITEIFADPVPTVGLPEIEFVEILNRSKNQFDLEGWSLTDGNSSATLPSNIIQPGEYIILASDLSAFIRYGKVLEVSGLPSLNNSGDVVVLKDFDAAVVDSVSYSDSWYKDNERKNGGWTLELIDPENLCSEGENWIVSEDKSGGTPGKQNSVLSNKPDLQGPVLVSAIPLGPNSLHLTFNEKLDRSLPVPGDFILDPFVEVQKVSFGDASLRSLSLVLASEIQPNITYSITVNAAFDCAGNSINTNMNRIEFGLPQPANPEDIVINEVLFNPRPLGKDFIEIANASAKFINLKNWSVANFENGIPVNAKPLTSDNFLLMPGEYLILAEDTNAVASEYPLFNFDNVLILENLPSLNDDSGSVAVINDSQQVMDSFVYSDDLHSVFLDDTEGVSLERISFTTSASENQNWKSASSAVGFATPGLANSNRQPDLSLDDESVKIVPEVFVPVYGQPDFTQIHYKFEKGGYVANVHIYDPAGHLIKHIASNELLGAEGLLRWDGDRDDGQKARVGYYMVWFEIFDETGVVKTFRRRMAVAAKF